MAAFVLYDCDIGFTFNGVNYNFTHVDSVEIEDPERTRLIRGANAGNSLGLIYKEGLKDAKTVTVNGMALTAEQHTLLKQIYASKSRVDVYIVARSDGSSKIAKNSVLSQDPKQLSMNDSPDSLIVALIFESFDVKEVHKS